VKLHFDAGNDNKVVTLGTIGPWTLRAQCVTGGVTVPAPFNIFADGPGSADLTYTTAFNEGTATPGLTHVDLSSSNELLSIGVKCVDRVRFVGTLVLSAGATAPVVTVPFSIFSDGVAQRCAFVGTAVAAG